MPSRRPPLRDHLRANLRILFVGINPGIRSAAIGHHFAGYSNRFWKLLFDAGLVTERLRAEDDSRLPEWELGITNLIARPTPGINELAPGDYVTGLRILRRKVRRVRPRIVAFVGVSLYRFAFGVKDPVALGPVPDTFEGSSVFVLPNPSGRNANFTYDQMLSAFKTLETITVRRDDSRHSGG